MVKRVKRLDPLYPRGAKGILLLLTSKSKGILLLLTSKGLGLKQRRPRRGKKGDKGEGDTPSE